MAKRTYLKFKQDVFLKDVLYNLSPKSGASVEYCIGLTVGVVASLMANGLDFNQAIDTVACYMPDGGRLAVSVSWREDLAAKLTARGKKWLAVAKAAK